MSDYTERLVEGREKWAVAAQLQVPLTHEAENAPSLRKCRYAVLPLGIQADDGRRGYAIYDRILNRIVDGVYYMPLPEVLRVVADLNATGEPYTEHAPNGAALGLVYPTAQDRTPEGDAE